MYFALPYMVEMEGAVGESAAKAQEKINKIKETSKAGIDAAKKVGASIKDTANTLRNTADQLQDSTQKMEDLKKQIEVETKDLNQAAE